MVSTEDFLSSIADPIEKDLRRLLKTLQQNGVIERINEERVKCMLSDAKLPKSF